MDLDNLDPLQHEMLRTLWAALYDLNKAAEELRKPTFPETPFPRKRMFQIEEKIIWPGNRLQNIQVGNTSYYLPAAAPPQQGKIEWVVSDVMLYILKACRWQPRRVLRAIRRIEAAAAWCRARRAGRLRAAQEILSQQSRAVDVIEATSALQALAH